MGNSRQDVQRLFGHFGLDPTDYVDSFAHGNAGPAPSVPSGLAPGVETGPHAAGDTDLFDYRNFDLRR